MSSYEALRAKTLNKTEANAKIAEEEGKEWTRKLFNLILCVVPGTEEDDKPKNKNKKKINNDDEEVKHESIAFNKKLDNIDDDILRSDEKRKGNENKLSLPSIIRINLTKLVNFCKIFILLDFLSTSYT